LTVELSRPYLVAVELDDDDLSDQVEVDSQVDRESLEHLAEVVVELEEESGGGGFVQLGDGCLVDVHVFVLLVFFCVGCFREGDDRVAEVDADVGLLAFFHVLQQQLF